ncbi:PucR family transcriptional regulator [Bacillus sp. 1NLA3E]|uniref:PucR family transcriptional regulator n=1 Tax=Bacillus sp. 1NLA3E TaxID=666686 RepID=UPI000247E75B|nr:helix-turn-helix domain-containing protein [Bacillus sp. 1NLA3E]AGK52533.1 transcriptional regulator [Bacillus sp. 1NLA3E]
MLNKLATLYINTVVSSNPLNDGKSLCYHWFRNLEKGNWFGIPKNEIGDSELAVLQTLFDYIPILPSPFFGSLEAKKWQQFLFLKGDSPITYGQIIRISQFSYSGEKILLSELEAALKGFFHNNTIIVWQDPFNGLIIEINPHLFENDFESIVQTLESEFFINPYFYVGRHRPLSNETPVIFSDESKMFEKGRSLLPMERVLGFEKLFPLFITLQLSDELQKILQRDLLPVFSEDHEMLVTIKAFIEHNLNVTLTAKKLFIHRNSLQYRLDKFTEKTGINLKSFQGAVTVYQACLLFELS